jgi:magnesium transporter
VIVECAVYEDGERRPGELELEQACEAASEPGAFVWIDLFEPTQGEFRALREEFGLHPLAVEDALMAHERPKLERYGDVAFLALKTAVYDDAAEEVRIGEIMLFSGEAFVITVRHGEGTELDDVRERVEAQPDTLRRGPTGTLHAVLDHVVDAYEPVVRGLQTDIDEVENALFGGDGDASTRRIYELGREVLEFSRAVQPLVEPVTRLAESGETAAGQAVDDELRRYFSDVRDHVVRIDGWVAAQRELLSNLLQANLTQVTIGQNADMRRISAWVAIFAVPTAIAGIYGMNFDHMPELRWSLGYPAVLMTIVVVCSVLYWRFKRAGWL